jgi:hypothetical protein
MVSREIDRQRKTERDTNRRRKTPRDTETQREVPTDRERHRETPRDRERQEKRENISEKNEKKVFFPFCRFLYDRVLYKELNTMQNFTNLHHVLNVRYHYKQLQTMHKKFTMFQAMVVITIMLTMATVGGQPDPKRFSRLRRC